MSNENWYQSDSWYEPLQRPAAQEEPAEVPPVKKKRKKWPWVLGCVLLSLGLIIGLSIALREEPPQEAQLPEFRLPHSTPRSDSGDSSKSSDKGSDKSSDKSGDIPSYREFFDAFYTVESSEAVAVNISPAEAGGDFRLELKPAAGDELSLKQLYERCYPSVVGISGYTRGQVGYSWGSGVILTEDGLILTNTHVVDGCDSATVTLYDDTEYEAKLVGYDSISDIALLRIEAEGLPAAEFGDSAALTVGQEVAAIGNPLGEQFRMTLTNGIVSAISRDVNYKGRVLTLLQTNAALNEGNSGGPLFNMNGQVIGITNMKMMSSGSSIEGIGFAIPSGTVQTVVNAILENGKVVGRVSIGITVGPIPDSALAEYELPAGLYIVSVEPGTDAAAKGLQAGDILVAVDGRPCIENSDLADYKDQFSVGDELVFTIWRDGETFDVSVALMDTNDVYG